MFRTGQLTILDTHVRRPSQDLSIARPRWRLDTDPGGESLPARQGLLVPVLATAGNGGWRISDAQNTDIVEGALTRPQAS